MTQPNKWLVYLLVCADGTYYCGATNDLSKRLDKHNAGKGAKYTKTRRPVRLLSFSRDMSKSEALKLEYKVKQAPRRQKPDMVMSPSEKK